VRSTRHSCELSEQAVVDQEKDGARAEEKNGAISGGDFSLRHFAKEPGQQVSPKYDQAKRCQSQSGAEWSGVFFKGDTPDEQKTERQNQ